MSAPNSFIYEGDPAIPLLHSSVILREGTTLDPSGKEGATRLLLHLMRRTAGGRTGDAVDLDLDSIGAGLNAQSARSHVGFSGTVISRNSERFFDLVEEIVENARLPEQELQRVKTELRAELIDLRDDDSALVRRYFVRRFYREHPYGRLPSGTVASVDRVTLEDLDAQRKRLFRSDNLVLCAAGDGRLPQLEEHASRVERVLSKVSAAPEPLAVAPPEPAGPTGRCLLFVDKPARSQTQIMIGCLGTHPRDADHTAFFVGHTIFGGTFSARLSQEVRAKRGWSYGAYSSLPFDRARQPFSLWTFPKSSDAGPCITLQIEMLEKLRSKGVSKRELAQAKKYLSRSHAFAIDTAAKRAGNRLEALLYDLPDGYHERYLERIRSVTLDEVNEALASRIRTEDLLIAVVGTHSEIGDDVARAIPGLAEVEIAAYDADS